MSKSLSIRVHEDKLLWDMIKAIGYVGWPFRELSTRLKPLIDQYGSRKVSAALIELAVHTGWRTMLNPAARKAAWSVLGPAPEQWNWHYTDWEGKPTPRPEHHKEPPIIPLPEGGAPLSPAGADVSFTRLALLLHPLPSQGGPRPAVGSPPGTFSPRVLPSSARATP